MQMRREKRGERGVAPKAKLLPRESYPYTVKRALRGAHTSGKAMQQRFIARCVLESGGKPSHRDVLRAKPRPQCGVGGCTQRPRQLHEFCDEHVDAQRAYDADIIAALRDA